MFDFRCNVDAKAIEAFKAANAAISEQAQIASGSFAKLLEGETCDEMLQSTIKWVRANTTGSYDPATKTITLSCPPFGAGTGIR